MTADRLPTRQECIDRAGEIYGAILADPERAEQIRQAMAERDAHERAERGGAAG